MDFLLARLAGVATPTLASLGSGLQEGEGAAGVGSAFAPCTQVRRSGEFSPSHRTTVFVHVTDMVK